MSVISCTEIAAQPREATWTYLQSREYVRHFLVENDTATDGAIVIEAAAVLPALGAYYNLSGTEYDTGSLCIKHEFHQRSDAPKFWDVACHYSSKIDLPASMNPGSVNANPLLRPAVITTGHVRSTEVREADVNGVPLCNSAGQPFEGIEWEVPIPTLKVVKNLATFDYVYARDILDCTNDDFWPPSTTDYLPDQLLMVGTDQSSKWEDGLSYWETTWEMHVKQEGWNESYKLLDAGWAYRDSNGNLIQVVDNQGHTPSSPVLLDGSGHLLNTTLWTHPPAQYISFQRYFAADFSGVPYV